MFEMSKFSIIKSFMFYLLFPLILLVTTDYSYSEEQKIKFKPLNAKEVKRIKADSDQGNLGLLISQEANPERPMSFAIGKNGEIYVLDQLKSRIQVFKNNKRLKTIPIPKEEALYFKDIEINPDNKIILAGEFFWKEGLIKIMSIFLIQMENS